MSSFDQAMMLGIRHRCGKQIQSDASVCPGCGGMIRWPEAVAQYLRGKKGEGYT